MVTPSSRRAKIQSVYIQFLHSYSVELQRFRSRLIAGYLPIIYAFSLCHDGVYVVLIYVDSEFLFEVLFRQLNVILCFG